MNSAFNDNYSGVLYFMDNEFRIKRHLRIGSVFEYPAITQSLQLMKDHFYLGSFSQASFDRENISESRKYFRLAKVDTSFNLVWDKTFFPVNGLDRIWLQGIKANPSGICYAYGTMGNNYFLDDQKTGFILRVDENGEFIPFLDSTTKAKDELDMRYIKTYPIPVVDVFNIDLRLPYKDFYFEIFDLNGKQIFQQALGNNEQNQINLSECIPGHYMYRISSDKKVFKSELLIKI